MIEIREYVESAIVELVIDGPISPEGHDYIAERFAAASNRYDSIHLLIVVNDLTFFLKQGFALAVNQFVALLKDVSRIAVVAERDWIRQVESLADSVIDAPIRFFETGSRETALEWLRLSQQGANPPLSPCNFG